MGGGLMQLVAYGAQDIYLTGNPQITFFKVVYRRHTNFSMESIQQTMSGTQNIDGGSATITISRNGDLISNVYVNVSVAVNSTVNDGSKFINNVELEIGGQKIDKHTSAWMNVWNELSTPESKAIGLKSMQRSIGAAGTGVQLVQVPLQFWFCRNIGLALPLIALQYHEVKLQFKWSLAAVHGGAAADTTAKVFVDYIYLDTDERRRFAQVSHEYLIEQVQENSLTAANANNKLTLNHPIKELIWTSPAENAYATAQLKLNGHDRFSEQEEEYFQLRQPYQHHTAVPKQNLPSAAQISTLDRQTIFETFTGDNGTPLQVRDDLAAGRNNQDRICLLAGTGEMSLRLHGANADHATQYATGTQIAIVVVAAGAAIDAAPVAANGDTYYGTIVNSVGTVVTTAQSAQFFINPHPTLTDGVGILNFMDGVAGAGTVRVFRVTNAASNQARTSKLTDKINVYSFALKPEEHQPSGTCNFSRIDTAQLQFGNGFAGTIYAVNYNVLRIMSGMGGLAYSN